MNGVSSEILYLQIIHTSDIILITLITQVDRQLGKSLKRL